MVVRVAKSNEDVKLWLSKSLMSYIPLWIGMVESGTNFVTLGLLLTCAV